jgi:hypothetical protein
MIEIERLLSEFNGIVIREAHVDSKLPAGVTLSFRLAPVPLPAQWKSMFTNLSNDSHGSVISATYPLLHGSDVVWQVVEGDIPNAKRFVEERVDKANLLYEQMLADEAERQALLHLEVTTQSEIDRLQRVLDNA